MAEEIIKTEERGGEKVEVVYALVEKEVRQLSEFDELVDLLKEYEVPTELRADMAREIIEKRKQLA